MAVRAKFECTSVDGGIESGGCATIRLEPVYGGSQENEQYWQATPAGSIVLSTVNENAAKQFEVGKEYYIDFTPAN